MDKPKGQIRRWLEAAGHIETIGSIAHSEFVRTLLWPAVVTVATMVSGYLGHVPVMWIIVGSALAFMGTVTGLLRGSEYIERKNPNGKIKFLTTSLGLDLVPLQEPNRAQRRGGAQAVVHTAPRQIDRAQLGAILINDSAFAISVIFESGESEIEGTMPPRSAYPKPPYIAGPGNIFTLNDTRMSMNNMSCQNLAGKYRFKLKYGLPGKERFELVLSHSVEIQMHPGTGIVTNVLTSQVSETK